MDREMTNLEAMHEDGWAPTRGPVRGSETPWGSVQYTQEIAPGVILASTAGHGGIWVDPKVSRAWPREAKLGSPNRRWWEEDVEALVPVFLTTTSAEMRQIAEREILRWYGSTVLDPLQAYLKGGE